MPGKTWNCDVRRLPCGCLSHSAQTVDTVSCVPEAQRRAVDLSEHRDVIRGMHIGAETKKRLLDDLEDVRLSLDEGNEFGFFQWIEIDESVRGVLADGEIDASELDPLEADIARMKSIQGIADDRE